MHQLSLSLLLYIQLMQIEVGQAASPLEGVVLCGGGIGQDDDGPERGRGWV